MGIGLGWFGEAGQVVVVVVVVVFVSRQAAEGAPHLALAAIANYLQQTNFAAK